jgi:hypothetical protein
MRTSLGLDLSLASLGRGAGFDLLSLSPLAWWRLNDGSGTTAVDSSGNGYDLTLTAGSTWIADGYDGKTAVRFTGLQGGDTTAAALLAALEGRSNFGLSVWARRSAYGDGTNPAMSIADGADATKSVMMYPYDQTFLSGGLPASRVSWDNNNDIIYIATLTMSAWHHFLFSSRGATDHELFIDGVSVASFATSRSLFGTLTKVGVGGWPDGTQFFGGDLKDAMLLPAGPTAAQAAAIYAWRGA